VYLEKISEIGFLRSKEHKHYIRSLDSDNIDKAVILNASGATSFTYKANNFLLDIDKLNSTSGNQKLRRRVDKFIESGGFFEFREIGNKTFEKNLRMIDSFLPEILSQMLEAFFSSKAKTTADLTKYIVDNNCLKGNILENFDYLDIKYKVKQLLINSALGMVPASEWDGFIKADGGYIIVREDGDVVCYHVYNISYLSEYLFNNTKFETGSSSRTGRGFATFYENENEVFYDYRLQIRFSL
jgi:type II restriction enzyme